jgi:hypothetical protein
MLIANEADQDNPAIRQNMPVVVNVHSWGGSINQGEGSARYERDDEPFILIAFALWDPMRPDTSQDQLNTSNWYWGNIWTDGGGKTWSVPWFHNAVIKALNEIIQDTTWTFNTIKATVDPNRVYIFGHSIGGTAALQLGCKHPEIFAAIHPNAGWTRYVEYGTNDNSFVNNSCGGSFPFMVGAKRIVDEECYPDSTVMIKGNEDQPYLGVSTDEYVAGLYTDLGWYFGTDDGTAGGTWNYRDPGFPTPFMFFSSGGSDNPPAQGDNLQPSLEISRRGYTFNRYDGGHSGFNWLKFNWLRGFRKDQSYLAFTNRDYGVNSLSQTGYFNDLNTRGWDPSTIIDSSDHYEVKLTGTGTSDVTIRRIQNLQHGPGSVYALKINSVAQSDVTADQYGLITIPQVADDALIRLDCKDCKPTIPQVPVTQNKKQVMNRVVLQVFPNPFSTSMEIQLISSTVPQFRSSTVKPEIRVFNINGKLVSVLDNCGTVELRNCGTSYIWDASNQPSGVYVIQVKTQNKTLVKRVTLLK